MTKGTYLVRRLRRDMRAAGFRGGIVVLFLLVMVCVPVEVVYQIQHGATVTNAVLDGWTHILASTVGYVMLLAAAVQLSLWKRLKAYLHWHTMMRVKEENDKLEQTRLGYEEQLMAKIIKARREIEEERRKDGEGWKK